MFHHHHPSMTRDFAGSNQRGWKTSAGWCRMRAAEDASKSGAEGSSRRRRVLSFTSERWTPGFGRHENQAPLCAAEKPPSVGPLLHFPRVDPGCKSNCCTAANRCGKHGEECRDLSSRHLRYRKSIIIAVERVNGTRACTAAEATMCSGETARGWEGDCQGQQSRAVDPLASHAAHSHVDTAVPSHRTIHRRLRAR